MSRPNNTQRTVKMHPSCVPVIHISLFNTLPVPTIATGEPYVHHRDLRRPIFWGGGDKIHIFLLLFYQSNEAWKVVTHTPALPKDILSINAAGLFDFILLLICNVGVSASLRWLVFSDPGYQGMLAVLETGVYPFPETWGFPSPFVGSLRPLKMVRKISSPKSPEANLKTSQLNCFQLVGVWHDQSLAVTKTGTYHNRGQ